MNSQNLPIDPEDLDLQRYVRAVLRRWWVTVVVALLVITLFVAWSSAKQRLTTSSITLQVTSPSVIHPLMRSTSAGQELLAIRSVGLINDAEREIGEGAGSLQPVSSRQPPLTDFVEISLISSAPESAFRRLSIYAETFRASRTKDIVLEANSVRKVLEQNLALAERQATELTTKIEAIDANKPNATPLGQALAERLDAIQKAKTDIDKLDFFVAKGPISVAFQSDVPVPDTSSLPKRLIPGIAFGLLAGLFAALILDLLLDRISSHRELDRTLVNVHVLGESSTSTLSDSDASMVASGIRVHAAQRGLRRVMISGSATEGEIRGVALAIQRFVDPNVVEVVASSSRSNAPGVVADAIAADGYILVVSARSTSRRSLVAAVARLKEVQRPLVGVILLRVRRIDRFAAARSVDVS